MNKYKELNKLQKLKDNGSITEEEFDIEKKKILDNNVNNTKKSKIYLIITVFIIVIILAVIGGILVLKNSKSKNDNSSNANGFKQTSGNIQANGIENISFYNMKPDDSKLTEEQRAVLQYFDSYNDYFYVTPDILQRYPQLFEQAKVRLIGGVVKVLKSTDDELELVVYEDEFGYQFGEYKTDVTPTLNGSNERLCIIRGEQIQERVIDNDWIEIHGRYVGVETREIDGTTYTLPVISSISLSQYQYSSAPTKPSKDTAKLVRTVAEYVFGKDVKVTQQTTKADSQDGSAESYYYLATLDNQSNANFKAFQMVEGEIIYDKEYNKLSDNIVKRLFISADFQHFIVSTYDSNLKYAYIDYFDKSLNKLWSREFEYNSNDIDKVSPMDYNQDKMAIVVDNDLYFIDLKTGKDIIEPKMVGYKTKVLMMSDGVILVGNENKDLIMKMNYKGDIVFRLDGDTDMSSVYDVLTQVVNGKLVMEVSGENANANPDNIEDVGLDKYMVINNDGKIEYSTKDLSNYKG